MAKTAIYFGVAAMLIACKSNNNNILDDINPGSFTAEVSGAVNQSFEGLALFSVQQLGPPTGNIFVLSMNSLNTDVVYAVNVSFSDSDRPGENTYTFEAQGTERMVDFRVFASDSNLQVYLAQSGQITFTSSSSQNLQGEITFEARHSQSNEEVQVSAFFNANCQQGDILSCD